MITESVAPARELSGRAPGGMWWVAWRQHRTVVLAGLGLMALVAVAMVVFRLIYDAHPPGGPGFRTDDVVWRLLRLSLLVLPVGLGALGGATVVGSERERGTILFAFSQGVSRSRWYWTSCAVVVPPLTLGVLGLGLVDQWVATAPGLEPWSPMAIPDFQITGTVPAILTLIAFGVGVPAGALVRSLTAAMSLAVIVAGIITITLGFGAYVDLVPAERTLAPPTVNSQVTPQGAYLVGLGYLDAAGQSAAVPACPSGPDPLDPAVDTSAPGNKCLAQAGIVASYWDYLTTQSRLRLTVTLAAIAAVIAAAGLSLGWWMVSRRL